MDTSSRNIEVKFGPILGLGQSEILPAAKGRNWLLILVASGVLLTGAGWVAGKVEELRRIEVAKIEAAKKAEEAKIAGLTRHAEEYEKRLTTGHSLLWPKVERIVARGQTDDLYAGLLKEYPAPIWKIIDPIYPWDFDKALEKDRLSWIQSQKAPNVDAEFERAKKRLIDAEQWVNNFDQVADARKYGMTAPEWFEKFRAPKLQKYTLRNGKQYPMGQLPPEDLEPAVPAPSAPQVSSRSDAAPAAPQVPSVPELPAPVVAQAEPQVPALPPLPEPAKPTPAQVKPKTAPAAGGRTQVLSW
jgi:hypothetical protein